ncbi:hypothetical protein M413DRAFT_75814, partial [Hebeloma cylindrosporum]
LHSRWSAEDSLRIPSCTILQDLGPHFHEALVRFENAFFSTDLSDIPKHQKPQFNGILENLHHPCQLREQFWRAKKALPFDTLESSWVMSKKTISCPQCHTQMQVGAPEFGRLMYKVPTVVVSALLIIGDN